MLTFFYMAFYTLGFSLSLLIGITIFNLKLSFPRILAVGFFQASISRLVYHFNTPVLLMIILAFFNMFILVRIFFSFNLITSSLVVIKSVILFLPMEMLALAIFIHNFNLSFSQVLSNPGLALSAILMLVTLLLTVYYVVRKKNIKMLPNKLKFIETEIENKTRIWILIFLAAENLIIIYYIIYSFVLSPPLPAYAPYMVTIALFLSLLAGILDAILCRFIENEIDLSLTREKVDNLSTLNQALQYQQHDFKHNLQVISSLIQMEKYDRLERYIRCLSDELQQLDFVTSTGHEALNGLLYYKISEADRHNLELEVNIQDKLENPALDSNQLCRVIGNLIDNAIEHLRKHQEGDKKIYLEIKKQQDKYLVVLENPLLEQEKLPENIAEIANPGYTTRKTSRGLGLAITREIITSKGGDFIIRTCQDDKIRFELAIPTATAG